MTDHEDESTETMSLGGTVQRGRLNRLMARVMARQQSRVIVGSTLLLGLVLAAAVYAGDESGAPDRRPMSSPEESIPSASPGFLAPPNDEMQGDHVWVGYHGVMFSLPRSWGHSDSKSCGTTTTVVPPPPRLPESKCSPHSTLQRSIVLWLRQDVNRPDLLDRGFVERSIDGRSVFIAPIEEAGPAYLQYVALPETDTLVVLRSPYLTTIRQLVQTLHGIPENWVSVPELRDQVPQRALKALGELDLVGRADHNSGLAMPAETVVVDQFPPGGQVVKRGTAVTIAVLPSDHAD